MKYNFSFFGFVFIMVFFTLFSSMGLFVNNGTDDTPITDLGAPYNQLGSSENNTGNNTNQTQTGNITAGCIWRPPVENKTTFKAGSTIPIKFACIGDNGTFIVDENVTVEIFDEGNNSVANFTVAKNPSIGIKIQDPTQYHVNWKTPKDGAGNYTIVVNFESGSSLSKSITLF